MNADNTNRPQTNIEKALAMRIRIAREDIAAERASLADALARLSRTAAEEAAAFRALANRTPSLGLVRGHADVVENQVRLIEKKEAALGELLKVAEWTKGGA